MIWCIKGYNVIIDDEDYERLKGHKYSVNSATIRIQGQFYFGRDACVDGIRACPKLHRDIMRCIPNDGKVVDHINGNTLDNRKSNLRVCTKAENTRNRKLNKNNASGVKGVCWNKRLNKWVAQIYGDGARIHLGLFDNIEDAARAYAEASKKYYGEFGRIV